MESHADLLLRARSESAADASKAQSTLKALLDDGPMAQVRGQALVLRARVLRMDLRHGEAANTADLARQIGRDLGDLPLSCDAVSEAALALVELGREAEAAAAVAEGLALVAQNPGRVDPARLLTTLAAVRRARGDDPGARAALGKAIEEARAHDNPDEETAARQLLAELDLAAGDAEAAADGFEQVIAERLGSGRGAELALAEALVSYGLALRALDRLDEAEATLARALDVARNSGARRVEHRALLALSEMTVAPEQAVHLAEQAVQRLPDAASPAQRADALQQLGRVRLSAGQPTAAYRAVTEAEALRRQLLLEARKSAAVSAPAPSAAKAEDRGSAQRLIDQMANEVELLRRQVAWYQALRGLLLPRLQGELKDAVKALAAASDQPRKGLKAQGIIEDLVVNWLKTERKIVPLPPPPVAVGPRLEACVEAFRGRADEKGLALSLRIHDGMPSPLLVDPERVIGVLEELLDNALKFTGSGRVEVQARWSEGKLHVSVEDSGPGIDAGARERIFKPFEHADPSVRKRFGGAGIGLGLAKNLAEQGGGTLRVHGGRLGGASFVLSLPARRDLPDELPDDAIGTQMSPLPDVTASRG